MSWTDERINTLKTLWEKGLTASQIADKLGNVSRNAVIGKAHRLGLKSRPSPVKAEGDPAPKPVAARKAAAKPPADTEIPPAAARATRTTASADETRAAAQQAKPLPVRAAVPAPPVRPRAPGEKVTLLDLSDKICKWPIGHPGEPDFQFCGKPSNPGFPYCMAHCAEAYQAQLPRDRNRSRSPMPPLPRVR